ncbi:MAG: RluA family pseudouridine synthase, partial [Spirochaetota bacterium]
DRYDHAAGNLYDMLKAHYGEIYTVHRLDRDTSGVILFAKDAESFRTMSIAFEQRRVVKKYIAILSGVPLEPHGTINFPIAEHPGKKGMMRTAKKGKESLTEYTIIEKFRDYSVAEVTLHTGRTHQIRVHFKAFGYPLAVDPMYGGQEDIRLSKIKKKKYHFPEWENERPLISRVSLHSWKLTFPHPATGESITCEAALAKDMTALLFQLRKLTK